ncbi:MAG: hypothetical protein MEQ07_12470, partial [Aquimonas sp.]|nr:hypothetical protein [Aquimonas sp.]
MSRAPRPCALQRVGQRYALANQEKTSSQEVAHCALLARIDVALGQQIQPQQMGKMPCIRVVVAVLQACVLRNRRSVHQPNIHTGIHQAIDQ